MMAIGHGLPRLWATEVSRRRELCMGSVFDRLEGTRSIEKPSRVEDDNIGVSGPK